MPETDDDFVTPPSDRDPIPGVTEPLPPAEKDEPAKKTTAKKTTGKK